MAVATLPEKLRGAGLMTNAVTLVIGAGIPSLTLVPCRMLCCAAVVLIRYACMAAPGPEQRIWARGLMCSWAFWACETNPKAPRSVDNRAALPIRRWYHPGRAFTLRQGRSRLLEQRLGTAL